jgi:hypothetical protein
VLIVIQYRDVQPLFLAVEVELSGISTRQDVRRYATALAHVYGEHWSHRISDPNAAFAIIHAYAATCHQRDIDDRAGDGAFLGPLTEDYRGGYTAELLVGHDDPNPPPGQAGGNWNSFNRWHGFTIRIDETLRYKGLDDGHPHLVYEQAYPMENVPIPPVDPVRQAAPLPHLSADVLRDHFMRQQRRISPEMSARLRVAGYDVPPDPVPAPPRPVRARAAAAGALPEVPAIAAGVRAVGL